MADNQRKTVNPVVAGLAGAAVGAAAAAGAIILSDEKNRKKLEKVLGELKDQGFKVVDVVQGQASNVRNLASRAGKKRKSKKGK